MQRYVTLPSSAAMEGWEASRHLTCDHDDDPPPVRIVDDGFYLV